MKTNNERKFTRLTVHLEGIELPDSVRNRFENDISHVINKLLAELDEVYRQETIRRIHEIDILPELDKDFKYGIWVGVNNSVLEKVALRHEL